ncbi:15511_t:CDS:2, partial [Racocetra fulgida]
MSDAVTGDSIASNSQYIFTIECNYHGKEIIDHKLVITVEIEEEESFTEQEYESYFDTDLESEQAGETSKKAHEREAEETEVEKMIKKIKHLG